MHSLYPSTCDIKNDHCLCCRDVISVKCLSLPLFLKDGEDGDETGSRNEVSGQAASGM